MRATELIEELTSIIHDCGEDVEVDEQWLRIILNMTVPKVINILTGRPVLKVVDDVRK